MPKKKPKSQDEHFETIELMLAGLILKRETTVADLAKLIGVGKERIREVFPDEGDQGSQ